MSYTLNADALPAVGDTIYPRDLDGKVTPGIVTRVGSIAGFYVPAPGQVLHGYEVAWRFHNSTTTLSANNGPDPRLVAIAADLAGDSDEYLRGQVELITQAAHWTDGQDHDSHKTAVREAILTIVNNA